MRSRTLIAACALALTVIPRVAAADGVAIVKGGPKAAAPRAQLIRALERARGELAVCLRGKRPGAVRIELHIAAGGGIVSSRHKTAGRVAQCVAGVLAVQSLSGVTAASTVTVDIATAGARGASTVTVDLDAELREHSAPLRACYDREAKKTRGLAGRVVMKFLVKPDGRILDPEVATSTLGSAAVESCLIDALGAVRLSERPGGKTLSMSYALELGGGSSGSAATAGDPSARPQKDGPLAAADIGRVMDANRPKFSACYDRVARKNRSLAGRVVLRFTIRGDGTVRNVKIRETTLDNPQVETCIVGVGQKLRFPGEAGRDVTKVFYPFVFSQ